MRRRGAAGGAGRRGRGGLHRLGLQLRDAGAVAGPAGDGLPARAGAGRGPVLPLVRNDGRADRARLRSAPRRGRTDTKSAPDAGLIQALNRPRTTLAMPSAPPTTSSWNGFKASLNSAAFW